MDSISFVIRRLEPGDIRPEFDCGDEDLNEYFRQDSIQGGKELLSVTYVAEQAGIAIAYFSLSNDSIRKQDIEKSMWRKLVNLVPYRKRYSSMPAVKVGRLAVAINAQRNGVGTQIMDFLKTWFTEGNKTGCRFIVVDAYNHEQAISFYKCNGFEFLLANDNNFETRLMCFDLSRFVYAKTR